MTTTTSQVATVVEALYDALAARLDGVTLFRYAPSERYMTKEYIAIAVRIPGTQRYPAATRNLKYDEFTLETEVCTFAAGAGDEAAATAMDRAEELAAEIEDEVRTNPHLGGLPVTVQYGGYVHEFYADESGRRHVLRVSTECMARMVSS